MDNNSIAKPNFIIYKTNWSCVIFAHFSKQFMLPPLNFSTSTLRVTIGMWIWSALVTSHGSFGWHVVFWNFMEFSLSWRTRVLCIRTKCLQTIMWTFFKEFSNSSQMRWESASSVNLDRSLYSRLKPGLIFLINSKFGYIGLHAQTFWCHPERFE